MATRFLAALLILILCAPAFGATAFFTDDHWIALQSRNTYALVVSATSEDYSNSPGVSTKLDAPDGVKAISISVRAGTAAIEYGTTSLAGAISGATFAVGLFDDPADAEAYRAGTLTRPPPYYAPIDASPVTFEALNVDHANYGTYFYPIASVRSMVILIQFGADAPTTCNQGIRFLVRFLRE